MGLWKLRTCDCVLDETDGKTPALVGFRARCAYHSKMTPDAAYTEIKSAALASALAIQAGRIALYGDGLNPEKHHDGAPDVKISLDATPGQRNVLIDAGQFAGKEIALSAELTKLGVVSGVELATLEAGVGK